MTDLAAHGGWPGLFARLADGADLSREEARDALRVILAGEASPAIIAGLIVGLRVKGEAIEEVAGMVDAMLEAAGTLELPDGTIDIVGTGGAAHRRAHALNVSTMASIVAAAAGAKVCKHGNRKASSTSGSIDLLDELGVKVDLDGTQVAHCVETVGVGFCFARTFHPAMRFAGPVRSELGIPTVFNVLGPLSHPGRVRRQVIGVAHPALLDQVAGVLAERGADRSWVVHGAGGLDELSTVGDNDVREVHDDEIISHRLDPADLGLARARGEELAGGDPAQNAEIARRVFAGEAGPARDIVVLNAGAGLVVAEVVASIEEGVRAAEAAIDRGRAAATLELLVETSHRAR